MSKEIKINTCAEHLKEWMRLMDKLYPKTVAKYKKLKIIAK